MPVKLALKAPVSPERSLSLDSKVGRQKQQILREGKQTEYRRNFFMANGTRTNTLKQAGFIESSNVIYSI